MSGWLTSAAFAGFQVPSGVYTASELDKAQADAKAGKKVLTFLYTDPSST